MISVIVPVYNMKSFLPRCMESLLSQTVDDNEILLIDDGSTDGSEALCDEYASNSHGRIKCLHKPNGGLPSARNAGIDAANGSFIIFPDPDDWVEPDYLEKLNSYQAFYNADMVCTGHYTDYDDRSIPVNPGESIRIMSGEEAQSSLLISPSMRGFAWNKLYRLDLIRENVLRFLDDVGTTEDLDFTYRYLQYCDTVCFDPEARTYHYYQRSGAATHSKFSDRQLKTLRTYEKIIESSGGDSLIGQAAKAEICNSAMNLLVSYIDSGKRDDDAYRLICDNIRKYYADYMRSDQYSMKRKIQAVMARYIPNAYGTIKSKFR